MDRREFNKLFGGVAMGALLVPESMGWMHYDGRIIQSVPNHEAYEATVRLYGKVRVPATQSYALRHAGNEDFIRREMAQMTDDLVRSLKRPYDRYLEETGQK